MARHRQRPKTRDAEKTRKRLVIFFGLFMIALMVFSLAPGFTGLPEEDLEYAGVEFALESRAGGGAVLTAELGGQKIEFQNLPPQVSYLEVDPQAMTLLRGGQQVVLTSSPDLDRYEAGLIDYVKLQLSLALQKTGNAITEPSAQYALPVVNCTHASPQMPVMVLSFSNETAGAVVNGSCIVVTGANQELMKLKDRLIFEYYGIMRDGVVVDE